MTVVSREQLSAYLGDPPRAWLVLRLTAPDGNSKELKLIADTGSPFIFVIGEEYVHTWTFGAGTNIETNFGSLQAAWFQFAMPEFGVTEKVYGYASDEVVAATKLSHPDFEGLAGLPLLRLFEYGGNPDQFWIRPLTQQR